MSEQKSVNLPLNTYKVVPTPKPNAEKITGLIKHSGRITGYQLSSGDIVQKAKAVQMAKDGEISGVGVATRNGNEYLKSLPDETENNNLGNLPSTTQ